MTRHVSQSRNPALDLPLLTSLRGFAAWWVVLFHIRTTLQPHVGSAAWNFLNSGNLAVDMFFVLSGFVIYLNYRDRIHPNAASITDFMVRRIARIYPLHLLMLGLTIIYALLRYWRDGTNWLGADWSALPLHLILAHNWGWGEGDLRWNDPSWSISTELFAYLLLPIFPLLTDWRRWPTWTLVLLIVGLGLVVHAYFDALGIAYAGDIMRTGLVRCVVQFTIGMLLCVTYLRLPKEDGRLCGILLLCAAGLAGTRALWSEAPVIPLIWSALLLGVALWPSRWPNPLTSRSLIYLGDVSYATYLFHYLAFIVFKLLAVTPGKATPLPLILAFMFVVLGASIALYHGVERPAQRWMLDRWRNRISRKAALLN